MDKLLSHWDNEKKDKLMKKIEEPLSKLRGWVNGQIAIMAARLYSNMIFVACLPSPLLERELDW